jgi:hypothetical protein
MFTIGPRLGCGMPGAAEPTTGPTDRADCSDPDGLAIHHPGIHLEPSEMGVLADL